MDAADATLRPETISTAESPSLLTIILDTNPHAWNLISSSLPLSKALANLLVFVNAHLAINPANRVAVLASHIDCVEWLYPSARSQADTNGVDREESSPIDNADKYRPFARVEHAISTNLQRLIRRTSASALEGAVNSQVAGALTKALAHISKQISGSSEAGSSQASFNYSDPSAMAGSNDATGQQTANQQRTLSPRILLITLSPDAPDQYIPVMNSIFASQRLSIPLDILPLTPSNKTFLQQAADATQGIYLPVTTPEAHAGLLQYLMFAYLPDLSARQHLISPGNDSNVDFRAACFCHRRIVDLGFVCSICLSIFCEPTLDENGGCLTCSSTLSLGDFGRKPAVVPAAKKKKKKKLTSQDDGGTPMSGVETPS
ncbi:hypothetical protein AMS68_004547 [Peltaster fructicola]|uniref:General transcription and DNA repair factor IIH subunit TFB4 n=1 Tax=Peltaster fructicola TaxID=286661 RepID=A0A6H0XX77_9PEZI|nr:hypothetical protein AMS68_004547 [Peltaster fructicola]